MEKIKMGNERIHYRSPNINVCYKISVKGNISDNQFEEAIEAVTKRHNMLTCTLKVDQNNCVWYLPNKIKLGIEIYDTDSNFSWEDWYQKTDAQAINFEKDPLVRFCVIRKCDVADIIIIGHHIIGDGIGYLNLLRDYLLALDGRLELVPVNLQINNSLKARLRFGLIARLFSANLNKAWRKSAKHFTHREYVEFFNTYRQKFIPCMYINKLSDIELSQLISKCKKSGLTVNEAIATAFIQGLQKVDCRYFNNSVRLGIAANIRNEMKVPMLEGMGNYTTGISIKVSFDNCKSYEENAKLIGEELRKKLNNPKTRYQVIHFLDMLDKDFIESAIFAAYGDYKNPASKKLAEILGETTSDKGIGISNLGVQNLDVYNTFEIIEILFVPPVFPANLINIGVITTNDNLNFCIRYSKSDISDETIEQIYASAIEVLTQKSILM